MARIALVTAGLMLTAGVSQAAVINGHAIGVLNQHDTTFGLLALPETYTDPFTLDFTLDTSKSTITGSGVYRVEIYNGALQSLTLSYGTSVYSVDFSGNSGPASSGINIRNNGYDGTFAETATLMDSFSLKANVDPTGGSFALTKTSVSFSLTERIPYLSPQPPALIPGFSTSLPIGAIDVSLANFFNTITFSRSLGSNTQGDFVMGNFNSMVLTEVAPVPLPAAVWLLMSGLGGIAAIARRRRGATMAAG